MIGHSYCTVCKRSSMFSKKINPTEPKNIFICKSKCSECCGIIPIHISIYEKHKNKIKRRIKQKHILGDFVVLMTDNLKCAFLKNHRCLIYEDRPDVCKKYGTCEELPCPYLKPNGHPWSEAKAKQIQKQINRNVDFVFNKAFK